MSGWTWDQGWAWEVWLKDQGMRELQAMAKVVETGTKWSKLRRGWE